MAGASLYSWSKFILMEMESLGPYVLRDPIVQSELVLPDGSRLKVFPAQDARTGIRVLVYRPITSPPPQEKVVGTLSWLEACEDAWVAEVPMGAVQAKGRQGLVGAEQLLLWARSLVDTLAHAETLGLVHGDLSPERLWFKGYKVWLEGYGLPVEPLYKDAEGLLKTLKAFAGPSWGMASWMQHIEAFAGGEIGVTELREELVNWRPGQARVEEEAGLKQAGLIGLSEAFPESTLDASQISAEPSEEQITVSLETPTETVQVAEEPGVPATVPTEADMVPDLPYQQALLESLPAEPSPAWPNFEEAETVEIKTPEPARNEPRSSLRVEVTEAAPPPEKKEEPRRIRIDEPTEPPFKIVEPPKPSTSRYLWLGLVALALVLGVMFWPRSRQAAGFEVPFRIDPPGNSARLEVVEAPEGSQAKPGTVIAVVPGTVRFDKAGYYRLRIKVAGRDPQEILQYVPDPRGVTITLK